VIYKSDAKKQMGKSNFGHKFHDLQYLIFGCFVIPSIHYELKGIITKIWRKYKFYHDISDEF
jgi:hypothetical protein